MIKYHARATDRSTAVVGSGSGCGSVAVVGGDDLVLLVFLWAAVVVVAVVLIAVVAVVVVLLMGCVEAGPSVYKAVIKSPRIVQPQPEEGGGGR